MNPSPQAIALIRAHVTDWGPTDATIAGTLNAPSVANPTPRATVARPFVTADLMGALDVAALTGIRNLPSLARLLDDIAAQVPGPLDNWVNLLVATGGITPTQGQALSAIVHATQPDPAWAAQISWAQANLGRAVDTQDIAASRPGA